MILSYPSLVSAIINPQPISFHLYVYPPAHPWIVFEANPRHCTISLVNIPEYNSKACLQKIRTVFKKQKHNHHAIITLNKLTILNLNTDWIFDFPDCPMMGFFFFFRLFNSGSEYGLYIATNLLCPLSFFSRQVPLPTLFFFAVSLTKQGHLPYSFPLSRIAICIHTHCLMCSSVPHIFCKLVVRFSGLIRMTSVTFGKNTL